MHFLEFLFGLLELWEVLAAVWEGMRWLFRAIGRGVRWIIYPSAEPQGRPEIREGRSRFPDERGAHLSLTRRGRGKWRGASYVMR